MGILRKWECWGSTLINLKLQSSPKTPKPRNYRRQWHGISMLTSSPQCYNQEIKEKKISVQKTYALLNVLEKNIWKIWDNTFQLQQRKQALSRVNPNPRFDFWGISKENKTKIVRILPCDAKIFPRGETYGIEVNIRNIDPKGRGRRSDIFHRYHLRHVEKVIESEKTKIWAENRETMRRIRVLCRGTWGERSTKGWDETGLWLEGL